ncbi:MAG: hypothetical protein ACI8ZX_000708 [Planctomycetota bacterium]|jgi:hypothetical protein
MIKNLIIILLCSICFTSSFAQEEEIIDDVHFKTIALAYERPVFTMKLALLSQLDFNSPSLQVGFEFRLAKWLGLHQEVGYVNNWLNPIYTLIDHRFSDNEKSKNGLKYIIEPRFYPFVSDRVFASRLFFAPSFDLRYVVINRDEWVTRHQSFQQKLKYDVTRLAYGANVKFGITTSIKKRLPIEMVIGIGARYVALNNTLPDDVNISQGSNNFLVQRPSIEGNSLHPSFYFGMLLHLVSSKKK